MSSHVVDKVYLDLLFKVSWDDFVSTDIRYDVSRKVSDFDTTMNEMINAIIGKLIEQ
jgi:hypothetical protein